MLVLEKSFTEVYDKMRLQFYRSVFSQVKEREGSLSATEMFSVEIINSLGRPTIGQFADFIGISLPGATYKVNALENKGYVRRVRSEEDRRESYLEMTQKYRDYAALNHENVTVAFRKVSEQFSEEYIQLFTRMLKLLHKELG